MECKIVLEELEKLTPEQKKYLYEATTFGLLPEIRWEYLGLALIGGAASLGGLWVLPYFRGKLKVIPYGIAAAGLGVAGYGIYNAFKPKPPERPGKEPPRGTRIKVLHYCPRNGDTLTVWLGHQATVLLENPTTERLNLLVRWNWHYVDKNEWYTKEKMVAVDPGSHYVFKYGKWSGFQQGTWTCYVEVLNPVTKEVLGRSATITISVTWRTLFTCKAPSGAIDG